MGPLPTLDKKKLYGAIIDGERRGQKFITHFKVFHDETKALLSSREFASFAVTIGDSTKANAFEATYLDRTLRFSLHIGMTSEFMVRAEVYCHQKRAFEEDSWSKVGQFCVDANAYSDIPNPFDKDETLSIDNDQAAVHIVLLFILTALKADPSV